MINGCENVSVVLETKQRSDQVCSKIYKNINFIACELLVKRVVTFGMVLYHNQ